MGAQVLCLIESKYAEDAQTSQYLSANIRTTIDKFTATNVSAGTVIFSINLVPNGDSAGPENCVLFERAILAGETYNCNEVVGHTLMVGDLISTLADTASALVIRASGRIVS